MRLVDVRQHPWTAYKLLKERELHQNISHKAMPTYAEHVAFLKSRPHRHWYAIREGRATVGCIYLSKQREIGIGILKSHRGKGYAKAAITELMRLHPGKFLANINPANEASINLFRSFGFTHIQNTYAKT